ncbi:MAG: tRNA (N(6)-L-threonylcarbamoyladenosine(37)-C(2))-methylthiotransferase MtaB [Methanobacteriota archaeon]|nr:MAG: tRNA (N(6)-L-threonylcarbamoyladenosine(37)-C(2))-methylthiotransferase MtaB [Euryarchaeota archaeon]
MERTIKKTRIAFYTFGCRLNQAETAIIEQSFSRKETQNLYEVVDYRESPDVLIVNTCTVTENGDADTRRLVNRVIRNNPQVKIALVGCQAQVQKDKLLELPNIHWVVGNAAKMDMEKILRESASDGPRVITPTIRRESFTIPLAGIDPRHTRANLKIQDGCDFFCSFCEIPYARGRARSREFDDILKEAETLAQSGHHELVLTGINIGTYQYQDKTLYDVIQQLSEIPELLRIRISSIEPTTIDWRIIELMAANTKLCRYLHIPLQSGSNTILQAMNRKYTVEEFADFIHRVREVIPEVCLGTDVIVGYPGEEEEEFQETYTTLLDLPLTYFHVFSYSERDHARSSKEANKVAREHIRHRSQRLRELSQRKRMVYHERFIGSEQLVLFEQRKNGYWSGLTDTYIRVLVESDKNIQNQLLPVRLEAIQGQHMVGKLLSFR